MTITLDYQTKESANIGTGCDKKPNGYKSTELGLIPENWEIKSIQEIAEVKGGKRLPLGGQLTKIKTPYPYIRIMDMYYGGINLSSLMYLSEDVYKKIKNYRISHKDIFISVAGSLGIVGKISKEIDGANLTENADKITNIQCDRDFLLHNLMSQRIQNKINEEKTVGAQPKLALNRIQSFKIGIPTSLEEQKTIAATLSDIDSLINSLDQLIAKKRNIKLAAMQQLLTGMQRLKGFNDEWQVVNMSDNFSLKARIGWQGLTTAEYLETGDYCLVTGTDIANGRINWANCFSVDFYRYNQDKNIQLQVGDVLLSKDGTIGKVAYVDHLPRPATLNSGVFVIRPKNKKVDSLYLFYILKSNIFINYLNKLQAGSTISHLYQKDFVGFKFLLPSIKEQMSIATILTDMDTELSALEQQLVKARNLKQGMMQELLTGRIRLT